MVSSSSQAKEKKKTQREKKHRKEKKMQRREGVYLSFLIFAFGMKCSSCLLLSMFFSTNLSTFFKPCVSRLFEVLCYSSSGAFLSFGDGVSGK
jgi:hypothetical protein